MKAYLESIDGVLCPLSEGYERVAKGETFKELKRSIRNLPLVENAMVNGKSCLLDVYFDSEDIPGMRAYVTCAGNIHFLVCY